MSELSRRELMQAAIAAGAVLSAGSLSRAAADAGTPATRAESLALQPLTCTWLDTPPGGMAGVTWGVPFARRQLKPTDPLRVEDDAAVAIPAQTWPTAYWPDGSVKWAAVAIGPTQAKGVRVAAGPPVAGGPVVRVAQAADAIVVDTGIVQCTLATAGDVLVRSMTRQGKPTLTNGRLVAMRQDQPSDAETVARQTFAGHVESAVVEQSGPVRAVVKLTGTHQAAGAAGAAGRQWLPFVVRFYFYAGSDVVRVVHSFVFDGDESKDFLCGLGVRFDVPMRDAPHDRHVRFVGQESGLFAEGLRTLTGLRRDPGEAARQAQLDGKPTAPDTWAPAVADRLPFIPVWGDFTLAQLSADGFQIHKRTKPGCGWIAAATGKRAAGVGYIGGVGGGISFGLRDFWQRHPTQLDVRNAGTDAAEVTLWLWSPQAPAMDLRMYHDVMGMATYDEQNEGLNITYEDYEPGYGTPFGIARTSELSLRVEAATPPRESLVAFAEIVRKPPMLMASPQAFLDAAVLGKQWTLPDRSTPTRAWIEDKLAGTLDAYVKEVDQRSWYGFWDYGDVMHSYDADRHVWKYDVGGFAWDNSELSTDLWLWLSVLRTGRADLFRMAEAMARHTGEVDVYHLGRFKGLGTRHGVQHWADSSKQSRISTPLYRRIFYYLTADERTGDLLTEQMHTIEAEKKIVIGRKLKPGSPTLPLPAIEDAPPGGDVRLGDLNYGNALAAWMTQAERTGDAAWHAKIVKAMGGIATLPHGFYSVGWTMNIDTGEIKHDGDTGIELSHLTACFGLPEVANELVNLYGDQAPTFADAWAQYGRLYDGTDAERKAELGDALKPGFFKEASLRDTHSRCTAFAAWHAKDDALARRAWTELLGTRFSPDAPQMKSVRIEPPLVLAPIDEYPLGTNGAAQWGLAAMECLALIGDKLA